MDAQSEQQDIFALPSQVTWSPAEVAELRGHGKFWRTHLEIGSKRSVRCKACGELILRGEQRLSVKRLNVAAQFYDRRGFVCADAEKCESNILVDSVCEAMLKELEDNPAAFEEQEE
jgi:hypothetical protein